MELESELRGLAAEIAWPETPALQPELAPRRHLPWRGRHVALAAVLVAVALGAVFAVPESRGAVLRFFGLGAVHLEFVAHLPAAAERPLSAGLGPAVSRAAAHNLLGRTPLEPPVTPRPTLHARDGVVSLLFAHEGDPVLLSELGSAGPWLKKIALTSTNVRSERVGAEPAIWIAGGKHVVVFPHAAPRIAGHVLVWQHGNLTLRLEGARLTLGDALDLADRLDRAP